VLGYGIGMALALVGTGLALAKSRDRIARWAERHRRGRESSIPLRLVRHLPTAAAAVVIVVGAGLVVRAALSL